jgi:glutamate-ammonia-ligase adenylyltransferase
VEHILKSLEKTLDSRWKAGIEFVKEQNLPNKQRALVFLEKLYRVYPELLKELPEEFFLSLIKLFSFSQFLGDFLCKNKERIKELAKIYDKPLKISELKIEVPENERELMKKIRTFKHLHMSRIVLRDILGISGFQELVRDTTLIHDACIKSAYAFAQKVFERRYGKPSCGFIVVDMGKAGGFELNYSSDVDLIFVYHNRYGETTGGTYGKLCNHDYFTLLSEYIIKLLSHKTEEGICMIVDTRLRPNGSMGPICNDLESLEEYYTAIAKPWERFALLKARPCAGDLKKTGVEFLELTKAFVFRKYVDLTLIEEVLRLKELIKAKVSKKGSKIDLKLGKGGIREVEFIVQAFQLIYGGKHPKIRSKNTLIALEQLLKNGFLQEKEYRELRDCYIFLRRAEHMLQITNFRQTQTFHPESEEAKELAIKMNFPSEKEFLGKLNSVMETVNKHFNRFFPTGTVKTLSSLTVSDYEKLGFKNPEEAKRLFDILLNLKVLSPEEANKLDVLGERLVGYLLNSPNPENAVKNLVNFFEKKEGKLFFFSSLAEINLLKLLIYLISTKNFFTVRFRETPEMLDFIFTPELLEQKISQEVLENSYKEFKNLKLLKNTFECVAVVRRRLKRTGLFEFFRELTEIADFCIKKVHEELSCPFSVAGLGKLGSREMNVDSDLDLLLFSEKPTEEDKKLGEEFLNKLKELGYETDTRLRPFGEKGELVFSVGYFKKYCEENARLWERLAFTRFRLITGKSLNLEEVVREFVFERPFGKKELEEAKSMREKLERELCKKEEKYCRGGLVDIEFAGYIYQILFRKPISTTYKVLEEMEKERFKGVLKLYEKLREKETEKKLFGIKTDDKEVRENVRKFYEEFLKWAEGRLEVSLKM